MTDKSYDLLVIGSGASGLAAAISAADNGARVAVLEKAPVYGGTSAVSGGSIWAPMNPYMQRLGLEDSIEDATAYIRANTLGQVSEGMIAQYIVSVNRMAAQVEARSGLRWEPNARHSDFQPHLPGARAGGRNLNVGLYDASRLEEFGLDLRPSHTAVPVTRGEVENWGEDTVHRWDWTLIAERVQKRQVGMGGALAGELLEGCARLGVTFRNCRRAVRLRRTDGRIHGVDVETPNGVEDWQASAGVVLASGGYEWNPAYVRRFLGVPMVAPGSPPTNEGDGLRMAMDVGAALGNMNQAWWGPMLTTGDTYDGELLHRATSGVRTLPGSIVVNRSGRRFVNEAIAANDFSKAMITFDPMTYAYPNLPCWLTFDSHFRRSYSVFSLMPDSPTPSWLTEAPTLAELAAALGIDREGLLGQVRTFNEDAERGIDSQFHRGESSYDQYHGDARQSTANKLLKPLVEAPFFGVELHFGSIGTNGGPIVDELGRVLAADGEQPIPGLFACGNVAASVFGPGYPGPGATIGAGMTMGYVIGNTIAGKAG
jgi:succinate dehydrogenase/fumarate reductase flavoprotein subunit